MVANVQNLTSGYISPQYHAVFDDLFQKVCGTWEYEVVTDSIFNRRLKKIEIVMLRKSLEKMVN